MDTDLFRPIDLGVDQDGNLVWSADGGRTIRRMIEEESTPGSSPLTGSGPPSDEDGVDQQLYIDTDSHEVYVKVEGSWT